MLKFILNLFKRETIGLSVLKPFQKHGFSSGEMDPRFDKNGNIYMLICKDKDNG